MVRRIYVEKKKGFDVEAQALEKDLRENLHLSGLTGVRVQNRYDVENLDDETFRHAVNNIFSEPPVDVVFEERMPDGGGAAVFGVEYLPGQYDQRADSAAQCIRLVNPAADPAVRFARIICLEGGVSEAELEAVKRYIINPVDSMEASPEKPDTLQKDLPQPEAVRQVDGFRALSEAELAEFRQARGLAMSDEDLRFVQAYFGEEQRNPTETELLVIDTYWSDHCRHTTFNTKLHQITFDGGPLSGLVEEAFAEYVQVRREVYGDQAETRDMSLMDLAVIGAKYLKKKGLLADLDESEEINACSIRVKADVGGTEEDWLVMFKNETHNHPTEIEPFGGAATCLGGAIRDPLSGRVYVYQAMRVTGSGDPRTPVEDTLPGKLPQQKITRGAAKGYSSYGNQIGLATGQVEEIYDEGYVAKRMEIGAVIGAAPADHVVRKSPRPGDVILLVGGRTGRDGCGGATGSSKEHTEESLTSCGAEVQKGNPPVERNLQRLFRRKDAAVLICKCNDFGAGGVSVAIGELADSIDVNLDRILKKYEGLNGTELAISESQERMAVVVSPEDRDRFMALAAEENLEAVPVAEVTDTGRFRMFWRGDRILDLKRSFLDTNGVKQLADVRIEERDVFTKIDEGSIKKTITVHLEDLNCCSRKGLIENFDSTVGAGTVLMPLGGKHQLTPALGMAAKLPVTSGDTDTATLMTWGFDPHIARLSPFHSALYAVVDSVTKIAAMGGEWRKTRLTFQEYFEKPGDDPVRWGKPFAALLGALKAQLALEIPSIGGKDSMSGSFLDLDVPPTLVSFAVNVTEAARVISPEFKNAGSRLVYLDNRWDDRMVIDFEQLKRNLDRVGELARKGKILSAGTIGRGGIFVSVAKMAVGNRIGAFLDFITENDLHEQNYGALILEIDRMESPERLFAGLEYKVIGHTTQRQEIAVEMIDADGGPAGFAIGITLDEILRKWNAPLEKIFPQTMDLKREEIPRIMYRKRSTLAPEVKVASPGALITVFPGTNCEMDSLRAFEKAGATVDLHILRNLTPQQLEESIHALRDKIRRSQILMIPGGFSGGDEPDGSAKFITAVFRNPYIQEAVSEFLEQRDGLILGICNGFQALVKLGLVPFGRILPADAESPTLTYNSIGRHVSTLVRTRVASTLSPWMAQTRVNEIHTIPVSHGEGRFVAGPELLMLMQDKGQIATQYVDLDGKPTNDFRYNPNNSVMAIESITSPDGRVLGKMAHSERIGCSLYKNVEGNFDQRIFESGVAWFRS